MTAVGANTAYAASCEFIVKNEWNSGFTASVKITNDGAAPVEGWDVILQFPDNTSITHAWNTNVSGGNPYTASNKGYNARIGVGANRSFGFNGRKAQSGNPVSIPMLSGICAAAQGDGRPVAHATADITAGTAPLAVRFDGTQSNDPDGDPLTYRWDFGDASSNGVTPEKTFTEAGEYTVLLTVNDGSNDSEPFAITVSVEAPAPESAACSYDVVNEWNSGFTGSVTISNTESTAIEEWTVFLSYPDGSQLTGTWNGVQSGSNPYRIDNANYNGRIAPGQSTSFGFNAQRPAEGAPNVAPTLGGICAGGITNSRPVARASVSVAAGDEPLTVEFDGLASSDPDGDPLTYAWDFDDGNSSTLAAPVHTFDASGAYLVTLVVSDGSLSSEAAEIAINVTEPDDPPEETSYTLDAARSSLHFVSTKKLHVVETHRFTRLDGAIGDDGAARITVDLNSVDTGIDLRDQRMRDHLFDVALFGDAEVTLNVELAQIDNLAVGASIYQTISPLLYLHGVSTTVEAQVRISRLSESAILVQSTQPVLIDAAAFALTDGIETLRNLAGLSSISYAVPTSFHLIFQAQ